MSIPNLLTILTLFVAVPINWYVTIRIWREHRAWPENAVLRERAVAAVAVAVVVTVFALIFANNDLVPPPLPFDATKFLTRTVLLVAAVVPPVYWLRLYR